MAGWKCPICKRWEDGTGPCAHTRPREDPTASWLREDLKKIPRRPLHNPPDARNSPEIPSSPEPA